MFWQNQGKYEYEVGTDGKYTGRYRFVGGRLASGLWPAWDQYGNMSYS